MKILIYSQTFYPITGGLEHVTLLLAKGFVAHGEQVKVMTCTPLLECTELEEGFEVVRKPNTGATLRLMNWCTVFLQQAMSLKSPWWLALLQRKWILVHHFTYFRSNGSIRAADWLKRLLGSLPPGVACSQYVNNTLIRKVQVIPNPFHHEVFRRTCAARRTNELLFAGRLVDDKGTALLISAIHLLAEKYQVPVRLTVAGDGPNFRQLEEMIRRLRLHRLVDMPGLLSPQELALEMNRHRVLVLPSVAEPYGLTALEGLACGCLPIVSANGGLLEATGGYGLSLRSREPNELAARILAGLRATRNGLPETEAMTEFLASRNYLRISRLYLNFLKART